MDEIGVEPAFAGRNALRSDGGGAARSCSSRSAALSAWDRSARSARHPRNPAEALRDRLFQPALAMSCIPTQMPMNGRPSVSTAWRSASSMPGTACSPRGNRHRRRRPGSTTRSARRTISGSSVRRMSMSTRPRARRARKPWWRAQIARAIVDDRKCRHQLQSERGEGAGPKGRLSSEFWARRMRLSWFESPSLRQRPCPHIADFGLGPSLAIRAAVSRQPCRRSFQALRLGPSSATRSPIRSGSAAAASPKPFVPACQPIRTSSAKDRDGGQKQAVPEQPERGHEQRDQRKPVAHEQRLLAGLHTTRGSKTRKRFMSADPSCQNALGEGTRSACLGSICKASPSTRATALKQVSAIWCEFSP